MVKLAKNAKKIKLDTNNIWSERTSQILKETLRHLARTGKQTKWDIHKRLNRQYPDVSNAIDRLEAEKLIFRFSQEPKKNKRKKHYFGLTPIGIKHIILDPENQDETKALKSSQFWKINFEMCEEGIDLPSDIINENFYLFEKNLIKINRELFLPQYFFDFISTIKKKISNLSEIDRKIIIAIGTLEFPLLKNIAKSLKINQQIVKQHIQNLLSIGIIHVNIVPQNLAEFIVLKVMQLENKNRFELTHVGLLTLFKILSEEKLSLKQLDQIMSQVKNQNIKLLPHILKGNINERLKINFQNFLKNFNSIYYMEDLSQIPIETFDNYYLCSRLQVLLQHTNKFRLQIHVISGIHALEEWLEPKEKERLAHDLKEYFRGIEKHSLFIGRAAIEHIMENHFLEQRKFFHNELATKFLKGWFSELDTKFPEEWFSDLATQSSKLHFPKKLEKLEHVGIKLSQLMIETGLREIPNTGSEYFWVIEQLFYERITNRITFDFFQLYFALHADEKNQVSEKIMIGDQRLEEWFRKYRQDIIDFGKNELNSLENPIEVFWNEM